MVRGENPAILIGSKDNKFKWGGASSLDVRKLWVVYSTKMLT